MAEAKICFDRLKKFLLLPEYQPPQNSGLENEDGFVIDLEDFSAYREEVTEEQAQKPMEGTIQVLSDLNLKVRQGELVGLVGGVGSGKSSLIAAIMGELNGQVTGKIQIHGRLALVPQQ